MDDVSPFIKKNSEAVFISLKVETHFAIHIQNNQVVIIESTEILEEFVDFRRIFREVNPRVQYEAATQEHIEAAAFFRLLEVNLQCYLVLRKEVQALSEQFTRFFFLNSRVKSKRQYHNRYMIFCWSIFEVKSIKLIFKRLKTTIPTQRKIFWDFSTVSKRISEIAGLVSHFLVLLVLC